jgi:hypothetical protein
MCDACARHRAKSECLRYPYPGPSVPQNYLVHRFDERRVCADIYRAGTTGFDTAEYEIQVHSSVACDNWHVSEPWQYWSGRVCCAHLDCHVGVPTSVTVHVIACMPGGPGDCGTFASPRANPLRVRCAPCTLRKREKKVKRA